MSKGAWPEFYESMKLNTKVESNDDWCIFERNYEDYKNREKGKNKIPKILHQIWIGGEVKDSEKKYINTVKQNLSKEWDYKFWNDNNIKELKFLDFNLFERLKNTRGGIGKQADLVRYAVLLEYGGVYIDTDFILYKDFDELLDLEFFTGTAYDPVPRIFNGLIGCIKGSAVIKDFLELDRDITEDAMTVLGPHFTTRKILPHIRANKNIVSFPVTFFYPYPNHARYRTISSNWRDYIRDETIGMHFWSSVWMDEEYLYNKGLLL